MLIDFTVENYRSIKDPVTLSAVAQKARGGRARQESANGAGRGKSDDEIAPAYPAEGRGFHLLPVLALYGANESGKSNVISALNLFLGYAKFGSGAQGPKVDIFVPFLLSKESKKAPTRFEVRVALEQGIYTYQLELDRKRVLLEHLDRVPPPPKRNIARLLFHREWNSKTEKYEWDNGDEFSGPHVQLQPSLKEDEPFLSLTKSLEFPAIDDFVFWLSRRSLGVAPGAESVDFQSAAQLFFAVPELRAEAVQLMRRCDTGIIGVEITKSDGDEYRVWAHHDAPEGKIRWPFAWESLGTQRLFSLADRIILARKFGTLLIVDELGSNLHPNIARHIIELFQNPKTNPKRAQLIFTSHDNTLMSDRLLRRDQIWFTQKRPDGSTELYPLTDFKPRNDLALGRAYLDGRFGAVPILPPVEETFQPAPSYPVDEMELEEVAT